MYMYIVILLLAQDKQVDAELHGQKIRHATIKKATL